MRHPILGTLRKDLVLAFTILAFATVAIAAAQWTAHHKKDAAVLALGDDQGFGSKAEAADVQLGSASSPLFTSASPTASPALEPTGDLPVPHFTLASAAAPHDAAVHQGGGFVFGTSTSDTRAYSSSSAGAGGSGGSFGGGMSLGGAWGGVSGTAAAKTTATGTSKPAAAAAAAVKTKTTGGGPSSAAQSNAAETAQATAPAFTGGEPVHPGTGGELPDAPPHNGDGGHGNEPEPHNGGPGGPGGPGGGGPGGPGGPAPIPEPVTLLLVGIGGVAVYGMRRYLN
jgi:hypothetical protein